MQSSDEVARPRGEAAAALVAHHREFLGFLERRVGDRHLAEEILQEAFTRGLERIDGLRAEESAVAWFYRLLRNAVIDRARRAGAAERRLETWARRLEGQTQPDPAEQGELCRCVGPLVETLKPEYAAALRRVELEGVQVKAFAAEAGITPNNAAVRLHRAREALRRQLAEACSTCAEHGCLDCSCG